jgi:hypothetical protein
MKSQYVLSMIFVRLSYTIFRQTRDVGSATEVMIIARIETVLNVQ